MNLRQALVTGMTVALVASVAAVFAAPAASAENAQPTYGLDLTLPDKIGAGGSAVPFQVKVTRSAYDDPVDLTLAFTDEDDPRPEHLAITLDGKAVEVTGDPGKLSAVVTVPFAKQDLEKTLQFTAKLKVPGFGDGTGSAAIPHRNLMSLAQPGTTSERTLEPRPGPSRDPRRELSCALLERHTRRFADLKLDASLRYSFAEGATNALATKSGTVAVGAPTVRFASVPLTYVSGGEPRPVEIAADNDTRSDYATTFPYLLVAKQDFTEDDADNVIIMQNGKRLPVEAGETASFFSTLAKLSVPAGQTASAPQVKVGFGKDVKPGKALLVAVLFDKATIAERPGQLSANLACAEITVTPVDDTPSPTATPTSTPTPTPTPSATEATPTPSPTATPAPDTKASPLARTGANLMAGLLGAVLLLAGIGALVVTHRRKTANRG